MKLVVVVMSAYLQIVAGGGVVNANPARIDSRAVVTSTSTSQNWAGYVALAQSREFGWEVADWIVPPVSCPPTGDFHSSAWLGQGGVAKNDELYQTGTVGSCHSGVASYRAWWEYVPGNSEKDYPSSVLPGDHIQASIGYLSNDTIQLALLDFGSSWDQTLTSLKWSNLTPLHSTSLSKSAECIVERPLAKGSLVKLADFSKTQFPFVGSTPWDLPGCQAEIGSAPAFSLAQSGSVLPQGVTSSGITMKTAIGKVLAKPSAKSITGAFTVVWKAAG